MIEIYAGPVIYVVAGVALQTRPKVVSRFAGGCHAVVTAGTTAGNCKMIEIGGNPRDGGVAGIALR